MSFCHCFRANVRPCGQWSRSSSTPTTDCCNRRSHSDTGSMHTNNCQWAHEYDVCNVMWFFCDPSFTLPPLLTSNINILLPWLLVRGIGQLYEHAFSPSLLPTPHCHWHVAWSFWQVVTVPPVYGLLTYLQVMESLEIFHRPTQGLSVLLTFRKGPTHTVNLKIISWQLLTLKYQWRKDWNN